MKLKIGLVSIALAGAALAGCGSDSEGEESSEQASSPQHAITQIGEVRNGLDEALATYASGDAAKADEQVGDAYLQHFELVEGPLEDKDAELNEKLEDSIREELREKIKAKAPKAEVQDLADAIKADLAEAEAALR